VPIKLHGITPQVAQEPTEALFDCRQYLVLREVLAEMIVPLALVLQLYLESRVT